MTLKAPFPYFGGKSRIASRVWERFGDTPNYVEPFAGSLAVLLGRPHVPKIETVNDIDAYISNFWRALQHVPDEVAYWADWPVSDIDLHARGDAIFYGETAEAFRKRMIADPEWYDAKIAGWWVWGLSCWIGRDWGPRNPPQLRNGRGVDRQLPHLRDAGQGVKRQRQNLAEYLAQLADRLRKVRVCNGDWKRVTGPSVTTFHGITSVFLDPPYQSAYRKKVYIHDCYGVAHEVREWAIANGDNPKLRIAVCGYDDQEFPRDWERMAWKANGGMANSRKKGKNLNAHREVVWFSPHCLKPNDYLFGASVHENIL